MTTLSRRQPETLGDLTSIRLAPKGLIKRHGDQIVELIHRAAHRPDWGLPQVVRNGSDLWRTRQYLTCFLMTDGHANQYAPALVAPKPLLDTIVLSAPDTYQTLCALLGTWRSSVCGAALWRAIQGQDALRLANNEPGIFTPKA